MNLRLRYVVKFVCVFITSIKYPCFYARNRFLRESRISLLVALQEQNKNTYFKLQNNSRRPPIIIFFWGKIVAKVQPSSFGKQMRLKQEASFQQIQRH